MDWLSHCYRTKMDFGPGVGIKPVRWYFVPPGTPLYSPGPTVYTSLTWTPHDESPGPDLGEVWPGPTPYAASVPPDPALPVICQGDADAFNGVVDPLRRWPVWYKSYQRDHDGPHATLHIIINKGWHTWDRDRPHATVAAHGFFFGLIADHDKPLSTVKATAFWNGTAKDKDKPNATAKAIGKWSGTAADKDGPASASKGIGKWSGTAKDHDGTLLTLRYGKNPQWLDVFETYPGGIYSETAEYFGTANDEDKLASTSKGIGKWSGTAKDKDAPTSTHVSFQMVTPPGGCGSLPSIVRLRPSGYTGGCVNINSGQPNLTFSSVTNKWTGTVTPTGFSLITYTLSCLAGVWNLQASGGVTNGSGNTLTGTSGATPNLSGTVTFIPGGGCTGSGTMTITRT